jgi:NAD(P)-dependent dehydrogenase (short-subunit alcohol dehydrogenase family)
VATAHGARQRAPDPVSALAGGVAVVTGGAGSGAGLGQGLVRRLAAEGMRIVVLDLDGGGAEALATELRAAGSDALACTVDVTETDTLRAAAAYVRDRFGACNVLCAHVGGGGQGRFEDQGEGEWLAAMQTMVVGTVATVQSFLPLMRETGGLRHIVLTSSVAALAPGRYQGPYRAAKAAVTSIGETLAGELEPEGIGTTIAFPSGMQAAEMLDVARAIAGATLDDLTARMGDPVLATIAHEMVADPADVASGDDAAKPIVDAILAHRRYVVTHGTAFMHAYRERSRLLDGAVAEVSGRGERLTSSVTSFATSSGRGPTPT